MRDSYREITATGADVVAIGTGDTRYATAFIADERIPFLVLVDDDGEAAEAASVGTAGVLGIAGPRAWRGTASALAHGHRQHKTGARVRQLGATFVIGPDATVRYQHYDSEVSDGAPIEDLLAALPSDPPTGTE